MKRIALIGENSIAYVRCILKVWSEGNSVVLLDWKTPWPKMVEMLKEAGVETCYIDNVAYKNIYNQDKKEIKLRIYNNEQNGPEYLTQDCYDMFFENYEEDEAVVIYSSGTTGESKGIILSHRAINRNADSIIDYMKPNTDECIYIVRPLSHSSTLIGELLVALKTNTRVVLSPSVAIPRIIFNNISEYNVSILCLNPALLRLLTEEQSRNRYDIKTLKRIYICGSLLDEHLYEKAQSVFNKIKLYNMYGLTEAGPRVATQTDYYHTSNSVGVPIKNVEVVITDEYGNIISDNGYGIIHVNSPGLFSGYISGKDKHPSLYKGWLNTGDIGSIGSNGELYIQGRVDNVININAHKIYPEDIEKKLMNNSEITECVVFEMDINGDGFITCVYVSDIEISSRKFISILKDKMLSFEIPRIYMRVDAIPLNNNGKIDYTKLREIVKRNLLN